MTKLQNMPGGTNVITLLRSIRKVASEGNGRGFGYAGDSLAMIVKLVDQGLSNDAPRVGDCDRDAAAPWREYVFDIRELETAFARHRENSTR